MSSLYTSAAQVVIEDYVNDEEVILWAPEHPWVNGVTITAQQSAHTASLSVSFDIPIEEGKLAMDSGLFALGNYMKARIGYPDTNNWTPWIGGIMTPQKIGLSLSSDGVSGSVETDQVSQVVRMRYLPDSSNMTALSVIEAILDHVGMPFEVSSKAKMMLGAKISRGVSMGPTKVIIQQIRDILARYGCILVMKRDGVSVLWSLVHFSEVGANPVVATLLLRGGVDWEDSIFPLLSFQPEGDFVWLGKSYVANRFRTSPAPLAGNEGMTAAVISDVDNSVKTYEKKPEDVESPETEGKVLVAVTPVDKKSNEGLPVSNAPTDEIKVSNLVVQRRGEDGEAKDLDPIEQLVDTCVQQAKSGIKSSLTTIGLPHVWPTDSVLVKGCSSLYDGVYKVIDVVHSFTEGGYEVTVSGLTGASNMNAQDSIPPKVSANEETSPP